MYKWLMRKLFCSQDNHEWKLYLKQSTMDPPMGFLCRECAHGCGADQVKNGAGVWMPSDAPFVFDTVNSNHKQQMLEFKTAVRFDPKTVNNG